MTGHDGGESARALERSTREVGAECWAPRFDLSVPSRRPPFLALDDDKNEEQTEEAEEDADAEEERTEPLEALQDKNNEIHAVKKKGQPDSQVPRTGRFPFRRFTMSLRALIT